MGLGNPKWMSPEMRENFYGDNVKNEHPKSDIFSLGLIALYCIDSNEFKNNFSPILTKFNDKKPNKAMHSNYLKDFEESLLAYLDDFRLRNLNSPRILNFFYMLKNMFSFSPSARPSIQQLYEDFPLKSSHLVLKLYF